MNTKLSLISGCVVVIVALLVGAEHYIFHKPVATEGVSVTATLPGLQTSDAPWSPETAHLRDRLRILGLPALSEEGTALHIHQHLDIIVNGQTVPVPADIGINETEGFISDIHTHDTSGVIHVESPTVQTFTLGQFFDIWGLRFNATCIGSNCTDSAHALQVYVNGSLVAGDPRSITLSPHEEIAIVFGSLGSSTVPASYAFGPGL